MIVQPPSTRVVAACSLGLFLLLVFIYLPTHSSTSQGSSSNDDHSYSLGIESFGWRSNSAPAPKPANETLDFQEILYISMPQRTDRQDALSLMAAKTGIKLTFIPGVQASEMSEKAWPLTAPPEDPEKLAWLGIWRAHANAWRYVIDKGLGSALIIEDDVDWDLNLKDIMGLYNWQLRYNNTIRTNKSKDYKHDACEYGCDWHQLYIGQCKNSPHPTDRTHQSYHDPNGPKISTTNQADIEEMTKVWNFTAEDKNVRVISPTYDPLCMMGYAVSAEGARRTLYQMGGFKPIKMAIDLEMIHHNREGRMTSYTLTPPPFRKWSTKGKGNSDNQYRRRRRTANLESDVYGAEGLNADGVKQVRSTHEKAEELGMSMAGGSSKGLVTSVRQSLASWDGVVREWKGE